MNTTGTLERRCRRLLRAYPRWYLADRGEEMIGTLLDDSPEGRRWPSARDAWGLVAGGLRARSGLDRRQPVIVNVRLAVLLAVTLQLLHTGEFSLITAATWLWRLIADGQNTSVTPQDALLMASQLLGLAAAAAAWLGQRVIVVVAVLGAIAALWATRAGWSLWSILLVTALLAGLPLLTRNGERLPQSWLWLAAAVFAWVVLFDFAPVPASGMAPVTAFSYALDAVVVLSMFVDPRPALAWVLGFLYSSARGGSSYRIAVQLAGDRTWDAGLAAAICVAAAAVWRIRRQAVL